MRVCFVTGEYPPMRGGVADYTMTLAGVLQEIGVEPHIITSARASSSEPSPYPVFPIMKNWGFGAWHRIEDLLRELRVEIVHIQYQTAAYGMHPAINFLPSWLRRRLRCRVVVTLHDLRVPYLFPKAGRVRQWVNARLIRDSNAAVLSNKEDLAAAKQLAPNASLCLIPIGNSIPMIMPPNFGRDVQRSRLGIKTEEYLLSYFGLLNQSKGVEFLLAALRHLLDHGVPVKLLMLGEELGEADSTNLAYRAKILSIMGDLRLREAVMRTGYLPPAELSACFLASDICVLPFIDGASFRRTSLLAALAHGLPLVTTEMTRGQGRLLSGENCLLVPRRNAEALAEAVRVLLGSPTLREQLGKRALALSQEFSWEEIAQKTMQLYCQLLGR